MPENNNNNNHNNNKVPPRPLLTDLTKNGDSGIESIRGAQNLIRQFGKHVEPALYALLCDTQSETRATVDKALKAGGPAASAVLVPLLTSQFSIAPAIATMVSAVVLQAIATVGQEKMCRALGEMGGPKIVSSYKPPVPVKPAAIPVEIPRKFTPREPEEDDEPKQVTSSIRPVTTVIREPAPPPAPKHRMQEPEPVPQEEPVEVKPKRTRAKAEPKAKAKTKAAKPKVKAKTKTKTATKKAVTKRKITK
jgi:outer membrane biosynthesis protein TonB